METLRAFGQARVWLTGVLSEARFSSLYWSKPLMDEAQSAFWNAAAAGVWSGTVETLLERLLMYESSAGRIRVPHRPKGPRLLDLDLLWAGPVVRQSKRIMVPHPGLAVRRFALEPFLELLPDASDPVSHLPYRTFLAQVMSQGVDRVGGTW